MPNKINEYLFPLSDGRSFDPGFIPGLGTPCAYLLLYIDESGKECYLKLCNTNNLKKEVIHDSQGQICYWIAKFNKPIILRWMEIDLMPYYSMLQNNKFKPPGSLEGLTKEFEEKGFDTEELLKDFFDIISKDEVAYESPVVQRAWVAGKLLTEKEKSKSFRSFSRESAYEILNYLLSFRSGKKAWNPDEGYHQKTKTGTYSHTLVAWKVIDDAAKANIFTTFDSINNNSQDETLSEFVEDNSDYLSYDYYVAHKWGLPVSSPIFDVYLTSLDELVEALREVCVAHNFHDVVELIDQTFSLSL